MLQTIPYKQILKLSNWTSIHGGLYKPNPDPTSRKTGPQTPRNFYEKNLTSCKNSRKTWTLKFCEKLDPTLKFEKKQTPPTRGPLCKK